MPRYLPATVGALVGAAAGYLAFAGLMKLGVYAIVLPGAAVGLGSNMFLGGRSLAMGVASAVLAAAVTVFCQWMFLPFAANTSLGYLLANFHKTPPVQLAMMALGVAIAFYFGRGR